MITTGERIRRSTRYTLFQHLLTPAYLKLNRRYTWWQWQKSQTRRFYDEYADLTSEQRARLDQDTVKRITSEYNAARNNFLIQLGLVVLLQTFHTLSGLFIIDICLSLGTCMLDIVVAPSI